MDEDPDRDVAYLKAAYTIARRYSALNNSARVVTYEHPWVQQSLRNSSLRPPLVEDARIEFLLREHANDEVKFQDWIVPDAYLEEKPALFNQKQPRQSKVDEIQYMPSQDSVQRILDNRNTPGQVSTLSLPVVKRALQQVTGGEDAFHHPNPVRTSADLPLPTEQNSFQNLLTHATQQDPRDKRIGPTLSPAIEFTNKPPQSPRSALPQYFKALARSPPSVNGSRVQDEHLFRPIHSTQDDDLGNDQAASKFRAPVAQMSSSKTTKTTDEQGNEAFPNFSNELAREAAMSNALEFGLGTHFSKVPNPFMKDISDHNTDGQSANDIDFEYDLTGIGRGPDSSRDDDNLGAMIRDEVQRPTMQLGEPGRNHPIPSPNGHPRPNQASDLGDDISSGVTNEELLIEGRKFLAAATRNPNIQLDPNIDIPQSSDGSPVLTPEVKKWLIYQVNKRRKAGDISPVKTPELDYDPLNDVLSPETERKEAERCLEAAKDIFWGQLLLCAKCTGDGDDDDDDDVANCPLHFEAAEFCKETYLDCDFDLADEQAICEIDDFEWDDVAALPTSSQESTTPTTHDLSITSPENSTPTTCTVNENRDACSATNPVAADKRSQESGLESENDPRIATPVRAKQSNIAINSPRSFKATNAHTRAQSSISDDDIVSLIQTSPDKPEDATPKRPFRPLKSTYRRSPKTKSTSKVFESVDQQMEQLSEKDRATSAAQLLVRQQELKREPFDPQRSINMAGSPLNSTANPKTYQGLQSSWSQPPSFGPQARLAAPYGYTSPYERTQNLLTGPAAETTALATNRGFSPTEAPYPQSASEYNTGYLGDPRGRIPQPHHSRRRFNFSSSNDSHHPATTTTMPPYPYHPTTVSSSPTQRLDPDNYSNTIRRNDQYHTSFAQSLNHPAANSPSWTSRNHEYRSGSSPQTLDHESPYRNLMSTSPETPTPSDRKYRRDDNNAVSGSSPSLPLSSSRGTLGNGPNLALPPRPPVAAPRTSPIKNQNKNKNKRASRFDFHSRSEGGP